MITIEAAGIIPRGLNVCACLVHNLHLSSIFLTIFLSASDTSCLAHVPLQPVPLRGQDW